MTEKNEAAFNGWAILELMGHRKMAGYVSEVTFAGKGMIRIDVPGKRPTLTERIESGEGGLPGGDEPCATQLYSPDALYCLTPTSEEMARAVAASAQPMPVARWELPAHEQDNDGRDHDHFPE
jgi:hypothetical protein